MPTGACRGRIQEHVVIGTLGQLISWRNQKTLTLSNIRVTVFEEADYLLTGRTVPRQLCLLGYMHLVDKHSAMLTRACVACSLGPMEALLNLGNGCMTSKEPIHKCACCSPAPPLEGL